MSLLASIPIRRIKPNPQQPRMAKNDKKLKTLADNIKLVGVLEPVLIYPKKDEYYMLIAGHRRLAAATMVGLESIPAIIIPSELATPLEAAVSENMLREDLNAIEVAHAMSVLEVMGADRKNLCAITGLSSSSISELLKINTISGKILQQCIANGNISKRFLIKLSQFDLQDMAPAYDHYLKHKALPPREKRNYGPTSGKKKVLLKQLESLCQSLKECPTIDYCQSDDVLDAKIRHAFVVVITTFRARGWFIPSSKFDASNLV